MNNDLRGLAADHAPRAGKALLAGSAVALILGGTAGCGEIPQQASEPAPAQVQPLSVPCDIQQSRLPRAADAAEQWLSRCYDTAQLPRTADGLDHAFRRGSQ